VITTSCIGESFSDSEDFEDDIILTKAQKALIDNPHSALYHDDVDLQTSAAMVIWPENTVPYYVPPELGRDLTIFICFKMDSTWCLLHLVLSKHRTSTLEVSFDITIFTIISFRCLAKTKVAKRFLAGIKQWQEKTCIKFVPRGNHRDWVQIFRERNPKSRRYIT
jgi:hypothetical protein